jgi:MFS family permease
MRHQARALRLPAFRRLWFGQLVSELGDWMALILVSSQLYQRNHSAVEAGAVFVVGLLPQVGIGQWLSTYADRYSRRAMMLIADAVRAVGFVMLAVSSAWLSPWAVLAVLFVAATFTEPFNAARSATVLDLVPESEYESAVWVDSLTQDLTQALGFAFGGIAIALFEPSVGLFVNAGTFVLSFLLIVGLPRAPVHASEHRPATSAGALVMAIRYLLSSRPIWTLVLVAILAESVATATDSAVIPFVSELGSGFGWLNGAVLGGTAAATLAITAAVVRDVDQTRAVKMIRVLVVLPVFAIPLLIAGSWWAQAAGLAFAALLSVPLVPAAMVVNPLLPTQVRATCRSVIVGAMVLAQVGVVSLVGSQVHRLGAGRAVAIAFGAAAVVCLALLWYGSRVTASRDRAVGQAAI